jgi:hypothetical protein
MKYLNPSVSGRVKDVNIVHSSRSIPIQVHYRRQNRLNLPPTITILLLTAVMPKAALGVGGLPVVVLVSQDNVSKHELAILE